MARYADPYNGDTYDTTATAAESEMEKKKLSRQILTMLDMIIAMNGVLLSPSARSIHEQRL